MGTTTFTWGTTLSGDWNTGTNWTPNGIPNGTSAFVDIANPGSYVIDIATGASDVVSGISISTPGPTIEVDGTLDFTGSAGTISEGTGDFATLAVNNGQVVNAGTIDPLVLVTSNATFTGTNTVYFNNELEASGGTAVVNTPGGIYGLGGTTLSAGVMGAVNNGVIDLGGSQLNVDIVTLSGADSGGYSDLQMNGTNAAINEWNNGSYVAIEQTLSTVTAGGTLHSLNHDYNTSNNMVLGNGGAIILANDTFTAGTVTVQSGGRLLGNGTTITSPIVNDGTVEAGSNLLVLAGSIEGTGTLTYYPDESVLPSLLGTIEVTGSTANDVVLLAGRGLQLDQPAGFTGSITAPIGSNIILQGITADSATIATAGTLSVMNGSSVVDTLNMTGDYSGDMFNVSSVTGGSEISVAAATVTCFVRGTRIRTPDGDIAVEDLSVGQPVSTASGGTAPVVWIGRRRLDCRRHPAPRRVLPVRVRAGALAPHVPARDVLLSPQHAVFDEGVLIPVQYLINGSTVVQEQVAEVEYFHVELSRHDVLLAEGLPAESYLENNDRNSFENGGGAMLLHPDFARWNWDGRACAELKVVGPQVDTVRAKLAERARTVGAAEVAAA